MKRTTVFAEDEALRQLRQIAKQETRTLSEIIRTALAPYVAGRRPRRRARSLVAIGRTGRRDVAERVEELLRAGFGS